MKKLTLLLVLCGFLSPLVAQQTFPLGGELSWENGSFEGAGISHDEWGLPVFMHRIALPQGGRLSARLLSERYEAIEDAKGLPPDLPAHIRISADAQWERRQTFGRVIMVPIRQVGEGQYERLVEFEMELTLHPEQQNHFQGRENTYNSVLEDGDIYKIAVSQYGIHKMDYDFLKNELGISDLDNIDPRQIKIYGNGGGRLPGLVSEPRYDDLEENAVFVAGETDGSFDNGDYILFYAEGPHELVYDGENGRFREEVNIYDNSNYYFIKISNGNGMRVSAQAGAGNPTYTTSTFSDHLRREDETYNLLDEYIYASGTGQKWYGDKFDLVTSRNYNFSIPNVDSDTPVDFVAEMAARRHNASSRFDATVNGETFQSSNMPGTNTSNVEATFAYRGVATGSVPATGTVSVTIGYNYPGGEAWLDFIELNFRRRLVFDGSQLRFRDINSVGQSATQFQINNTASGMEVWDVSSPAVKRQTLTGASFVADTESGLRSFVAFDPGGSFPSPAAVGGIANQNLHGIAATDALLVYHRDFEVAALALAEHREEHSGISIAMAEIGEVYNEFSSGSQDPTAIRDLAKMIYERDPNFKYLILLGDGSFDFKNNGELQYNPNFIPLFETANSLHPIYDFPTDDYFALLSDNEGDDLKGALDIAVGRLPVKTAQEAAAAVEKIIRYDTDSRTLGDWRNSLTYLADDEDGNSHFTQSDGIATLVDTTYNDFNINKIYFDAFQQVTSAGGNSYPDVKASINSSMFKGQLVMNYLGHGGPTGWAQERVLQESDISSWGNEYEMPLFITATCSFTAYDDPKRVSAGEKVFLKEDGGGIGLFSTTRAVFSGSNERLTRATFNTIFEKMNGEYPALGEILRVAKNSNSADTLDVNARKFLLIGDPTQHLAMPQYRVETTHINSLPLTGNDTLSALQQVSISGMVTDQAGNPMNDFNGQVFPTLYDKEQMIYTLRNDEGSRLDSFLLQKNILFKGAASVVNGTFTFTFVMPKDIDYQYGKGRISYYAHDGVDRDATGYTEDITIGGTAANPVNDDNPPLVEVFMDNEDFVFGGITSTNPVLFVKLSDDFGINVAGSGIGHDLTAVMDENAQNTIVLNDFYEAEVDDHRKGTARYPLSDLAPGRYNVRVKGWDVANNSGEGYTEFVVADGAEIALAHVLNYPNPFTTHTEFQFEHNLAGQAVRAQVQVFTVSGKLVKTIQHDAIAEGHRITGITWDGTDDYGERLGRGVYVYKVTVGSMSVDNAVSNSASSEFEKLVILR